MEPVLSVYIDITDQYLGELIEEVIEKYYLDKANMIDYDELLEFIASELIGDKKTDYRSYEKLLKKLSRNKQITKTLLSYLISRYIEERIETNDLF